MDRGHLRGAGLVFASVVVTLTLVAAVAVATGTIPGPDGVIHGCYDGATGALRVVPDGTDCRRNEFALQWNQTGPRGPAGPQGNTGATGPAGVVANFDAVVGLPCNLNGNPGTIRVNYGFPPAEDVTLTCLTPAGPADHLTCAFVPTMIIADGAAITTATVKVRDVDGQRVETGTYSVTFARVSSTAPGASSTLVTESPQLTVNGLATFIVRATTTPGVDTYAAIITPGSSPTLPNTLPNTTCSISIVLSFP